VCVFCNTHYISFHAQRDRGYQSERRHLSKAHDRAALHRQRLLSLSRELSVMGDAMIGCIAWIGCAGLLGERMNDSRVGFLRRKEQRSLGKNRNADGKHVSFSLSIDRHRIFF
jgi:hypothetical protein